MTSDKNFTSSHVAKRNRNDEFYTRLEDIEKELIFYSSFLEGKVVYCNADNPYYSNFFKFFVENFNRLKLKKLVTTCYSEDSIINKYSSKAHLNGAIKTVVKNVPNEFTLNAEDDFNKLFSLKGNKIESLSGNGDFLSAECEKILSKVDVVVTNPPFTLFIPLYNLIKKHNKKFILMCNINAFSYRDIFSDLINAKVLPGYSKMPSAFYFDYPQGDGYVTKRLGLIYWMTNIKLNIERDFMEFTETYSPEKYQEYDNFADVIEVPKVKDIPGDYFGMMAVPVTFIDKFNPQQFEILGVTSSSSAPLRTKVYHNKKHSIVGKIKGLNTSGVIKLPDGRLKIIYKRFIIRRLK